MDFVSKIQMEVCVDTVQSAVNAEKGGASRIELCSALSEGGLTASHGLLSVIKQCVKIPVHTMIRPRAGDFCYTDEEFEVMKIDIQQLKQLGADGMVFGILNRNGTVDTERCMELIDLSRPLPVTFHRAFDMTCDLSQSLEVIMRLGCERVLTSGGENSALEGTPMINKLRYQADGAIEIVPAGGINERNVKRILEETGAFEFHASCRQAEESKMDFRNKVVHFSQTVSSSEYCINNTSSERVETVLKVAKENM